MESRSIRSLHKSGARCRDDEAVSHTKLSNPPQCAGKENIEVNKLVLSTEPETLCVMESQGVAEKKWHA